jgi:hypothetical protein
LCCLTLGAQQPDVISPLVSYQFLDSLESPPTEPNVVSPIVSYLFYDWLGDERVEFSSSATVSYFYHDSVSSWYTGRILSTQGIPLDGATVVIKRFGTMFWQGQTDAGGYFTVPGLGKDLYAVVVTKEGFVTSITTSDGRRDGMHVLQISLSPVVIPPGQIAVARVPAETAIRQAASGPVSDHFRLFVGTRWVSDTSSINPNAMTVVISHGWKGDLDDWAKTMAYQIANGHGASPPPNIVAWDWKMLAATTAPPVDRACEQGVELGKALQQFLGTGYSQHIHFIGHSLGTIVNAYACDYVHGGFGRSSSNPPLPWSPFDTTPHVTLLDEAEIASVFGQNITTSAALGWKAAQLKGAILAGGVATVANWRSPIPRDATWIDNYISAVGVRHDEAVNVTLTAPLVSLPTTSIGGLIGALENAHGYSHLFYRNSINPTGTPPAIGFALSAASGGNFPPVGVGVTPGSQWFENIDTPDPFDLSRTAPDGAGFLDGPFTGDMPGLFALSLAAAPATGNSVLAGYNSGIQWAGDIGGNVIYTTGIVVAGTAQKVGFWWDAAQDQASDILNSLDPSSLLAGPLGASVFQIRLTKRQPQLQLQGRQTLSLLEASSSPDPETVPAAWFSIKVPADAAFMAFDFRVTGEPAEDRLACAINDQNLFTLPAAFAPDNQTVSTDLLDVTGYAGQTVEIFFGLVGGTSTDCEVTIDGLRFITLPKPGIAMTAGESGLAVQWPAAATGWTLQYSEDLAPESWVDLSSETNIVVKDGVAALPIPAPGDKGFYRLKKSAPPE